MSSNESTKHPQLWIIQIGIVAALTLLAGERKNTHSGSCFVYGDQGARFEQGFMFLQRADCNLLKMTGRHILSAHLDDAGSLGARGRKQGAEIQVVSEQDITIRPRPFDNTAVRSPWIANR